MEPAVAMSQLPAKFENAFPDEACCAAYLFERRWPEGFVCRICGSRRYASLKSRAYTYECLDYGHQTSITAGTVMHRSHLPLTKWFSAAHLIAPQPDTVSARQLQARLGIAYQTASVLKRKLQLSKIPGDDEPLQGLVEVNQTEISIQGFSRTFGHVTADNIIVAIALEVPDDEPAQAKPPNRRPIGTSSAMTIPAEAARRSDAIRGAARPLPV